MSITYNFRYKLCEVGPRHLGEFGVYDLVVDVENHKCELSNVLEPVNAYLAILYSILIVFGMVLVYALICFGLDKGYLSFIQRSIIRIKQVLYPEQVNPL